MRVLVLVVALATVAVGCGTGDGAAKEVVNVYTGRHYGIEPVFEAFTEATGIEVRFTVGGDPELRERLKAEGRNTPADVLMTADAGNLYLAAEDGLLASVDSDVLEAAIPSNLRDPEGRWFALSRRVRAIQYSTERVDPAELSTYEDLADPRWKGRLCLRPATHPYTQSLVASLIAAHGEAAAAEVVRGWVANEPVYIDSDEEILKAIAAGRCDVTIANHYYLARITSVEPDFPVAIFWPNQSDRGAHVNASGAGVTAHAPNPENARELIEWLATEGQRAFADANFEFPANPNVAPHPLIAAWGPFEADPIWVGEYGRLQPRAVVLLDRAGYL
jgi:iron(III) transport system substrate-binding protein